MEYRFNISDWVYTQPETFADNFSKRPAGDRWGLPRILLIIPYDEMTRIFVAFGAFFFLRENRQRYIAIVGNAISVRSPTRSTRFFWLVARIWLAVCTTREDACANNVFIADCNPFRDVETQSRLRSRLHKIAWWSLLILILIIPSPRLRDTDICAHIRQCGIVLRTER